MSSIGSTFPFEFCALRYFLQWHRKGLDLHRQIRANKPELSDIRTALCYFQVARNFEGLKQDDTANSVRDALLHVRATDSISYEQQVKILALSFKEAGFLHNLSAASKLLWLSSRKPIIYDSRVLRALKREYGHEPCRKDYEAYCVSWKRAYKQHQDAILTAASQLPRVRAFLTGNTPPNDRLRRIVCTPWFRRRVFDTHLWEIGGDD